MERIKEIWNQLENSPFTVTGLFKLRYSDTSKCDVFLGIKYPESYRLLIVRTPFSIGKDFNFKYEFRGLRFDKVYDADDSAYLLLNLVLVDRQFKDIFDTLIADVILNIICESEIKTVLKNYTNRLLKWESLFERFGQQGLNPEEQRGLYGELYFLRKYLQSNPEFQHVLNSWVGPTKEIRDFQAGSWSLEVKTTHGNNHQKVQISNERQLDTSNLENLFLFHLSLEARQQSGETLNQIVDTISEALNNDFISLSLFKSKLIEVGYFDIHKHLYENTGYYIRQELFYKVDRDFPRIEEKDIRNGVGDVKYSIVVSQCYEFVIVEDDVFQTINAL
jgi:hypothetical protein